MRTVDLQIFTEGARAGIKAVTIPHKSEVAAHTADERIGRLETVKDKTLLFLERRHLVAIAKDMKFKAMDERRQLQKERILAHGEAPRINDVIRLFLLTLIRLRLCRRTIIEEA